MEREFALIVAGGKGTRFGSAHPKQFMELNGKPIILHTIDAFFRYSDEITVVLVLPEQDQILWEEICDRHDYRKPLIIQTGGLTRFQSVRNGLKLIGDGFVAIHDGVRPLIGTDIIAASFRQARLHQCAAYCPAERN